MSTFDSLISFIPLPSRYYKNSVDQRPGWNSDAIQWCKREAERRNLIEHEYWGGYVTDEMKIQVRILSNGLLLLYSIQH